MAELFSDLSNWFFSLGETYGVNPIIFGTIYVGAIPFFTLSVGWLVKNYRAQKSLVLPAFSATLFFISSYLYLIIAGQNVPWWVYAVVIVMVVFGAWTTWKKIKTKIEAVDPEKPDPNLDDH